MQSVEIIVKLVVFSASWWLQMGMFGLDDETSKSCPSLLLNFPKLLCEEDEKFLVSREKAL